MMTDWAAFDRHIASRRRAIVEGFVEFVRLNSVSQDPAEGPRHRSSGWPPRCGRVASTDACFETGGNPVVFGERRVPGATRTVLLYGHYDTKPIPHKGWLQPNPHRARLPPRSRRGRGAGRVRSRSSPTTTWTARRSTRAARRTTRGRSGRHLHALESHGRTRDRADGQRQADLRRRGGDRQPLLRPVRRGAPRPAGRRRRDHHRRAPSTRAGGRPSAAARAAW